MGGGCPKDLWRSGTAIIFLGFWAGEGRRRRKPIMSIDWSEMGGGNKGLGLVQEEEEILKFMALNEASVFMGEGEEGYLDLEMERRLPPRYGLSSPPLFSQIIMQRRHKALIYNSWDMGTTSIELPPSPPPAI